MKRVHYTQNTEWSECHVTAIVLSYIQISQVQNELCNGEVLWNFTIKNVFFSVFFWSFKKLTVACKSLTVTLCIYYGLLMHLVAGYYNLQDEYQD